MIQQLCFYTVVGAGIILLIGGSICLVALTFLSIVKKVIKSIRNLTDPPVKPLTVDRHVAPPHPCPIPEMERHPKLPVDPPSFPANAVKCEECDYVIFDPSGSSIRDDGVYLSYKCSNCGWSAEYLK
jgi:hypothetical protein